MSDNKILIYRIGQLGDSVVSIPAIRKIKRLHKSDSLMLMTEVQRGKNYVAAWDVLGLINVFDELVCYSVGKERFKNIASLFLVGLKLRKKRVHRVYNLAPIRTTKQKIFDFVYFRLFVGARSYMSSSIENDRVLIYEWERLYKSMAENCEATTDFRGVGKGALSQIRQINKIVCCVGSKMQSKLWPIENYIELFKMIISKWPSIEIKVIGGPEDADDSDLLCKSIATNAVNYAGKLTISETLDFISDANIYIGNDTGPMHLAALQGIRCLALFSSRDSGLRWAPFGFGHALLRKDIECAGCMLEFCDKPNRCITQIKPADVFFNFERMYENCEMLASD